jgi:hypothetical protein
MSKEKQIEIAERLRKETSIKFSEISLKLDKSTLFVLAAAAFLFILLIIFYAADIDLIYVQFVVILITLLGLLLPIVEIVKGVVAFSNPVKTLLEPSYQRLRQRASIVESLVPESLIDLASVKSHLEEEVKGVRFRVGRLTGGLDKLGIFPAAFVLYFSYYLKLEESMPKKVVLPAMALILITYVLAVIVSVTVARLETMVRLVERAIEAKSNVDVEQDVAADT